MTSHVVYIDDSGTKDYSPTGYNSGPTRYFVFAGVLATQDSASQLAQRLSDLKKPYNNGKSFELKSNWLRMPHERDSRYLRPLGVTDAELKAIVDKVYGLVIDANIEIIACVVDKEHMWQTYGEKAYYPPAAAYETLAQRLQNALEGIGTCQVFIDDMTGKNPKGNEHKANLIRQHALLRKHGSRMLRPTLKIDVLEDLRFQSSARSELIQVADLVAYNVFRQFAVHGEDWEREATNLPTYDYFARLASKFRRGPNNRVQGYGIVKIPIRHRVVWVATKK